MTGYTEEQLEAAERILRSIEEQGGTVEEEAARAIEAIDENSSDLATRLAWLGEAILGIGLPGDAEEYELSDEDREIVRGWVPSERHIS